MDRATTLRHPGNGQWQRQTAVIVANDATNSGFPLVPTKTGTPGHPVERSEQPPRIPLSLPSGARQARRRAGMSGYGRPRQRRLGLVFLLVALLAGPLERRAKDVAERRAGIGGAVLLHRLFLLLDLQRLDRHRDLPAAAI